MTNKGLMSLGAVLPLALAVAAVLAPPGANAQADNDQALQSSAKTGAYRDLSATELRMAQTRQDKAQIEAAMAKTNMLLARASPAVRAWVRGEGQQQARREPSGSAVAAAARARFGDDLSTMDIDELVQMVMMESSRASEQELRDQLYQMQAINQRNRAQRQAAQKMRESQSAMGTAANAESRPAQPRVARADLAAYVARAGDGKDGLADMSEEQQLKMQMVMDRMQKALEAMSNLAKKESDTGKSIIGNLK